MSKVNLMVCVCVVFAFVQTNAMGRQLYFGGSYGWTDIDTGVSSLTGTASVDEDDNGFKVFVGTDINEILSIEGHYTDLGEAQLTGNNGDTFVYNGVTYTFTANNVKLRAEGTSYGLCAIGRIPLEGKIKPYGKVGVHFWDVDSKVSSSAGNASISDDGTDIFYGFGVEVEAHDRVSFRAEYEIYDFDGDDVEFISLGLAVKVK